jgi:hypothetical protein
VSIFTLAYYLKALTPALFGEAPDGQSGPRVALPSGAAMAALSALVLFGGVLMLPGVTSAIFNGAAAVLSDGIGYAYAVFGALR